MLSLALRALSAGSATGRLSVCFSVGAGLLLRWCRETDFGGLLRHLLPALRRAGLSLWVAGRGGTDLAVSEDAKKPNKRYHVLGKCALWCETVFEGRWPWRRRQLVDSEEAWKPNKSYYVPRNWLRGVELSLVERAQRSSVDHSNVISSCSQHVRMRPPLAVISTLFL